jgi:hypothetical protein
MYEREHFRGDSLLTQLSIVETAVLQFKVKNGDYPKELRILADGDPPLLEPSQLIDPWGKAYQYDRKGPNHNGSEPDVWTVKPDGKVVGNWTK